MIYATLIHVIIYYFMHPGIAAHQSPAAQVIAGWLAVKLCMEPMPLLAAYP